MALRRGYGLVLGLIVIAFAVSAAGLGALWLFTSRQPSVDRDSTLLLRLDTDLHEGTPDDVFRQILSGRRAPSLATIVENLRKAKVDDRIKAVVVAPSNLQAPYWAKVQEVRDAILDYRRSGKPAIAYLEFADDRTYYLATACDRIYLMPSSTLDLNGLASYELFLRGTLDKAGAYPDFVHIGEYKTAANQYTEYGFTPAHREMSTSLNRDLYEQLVRGIGEGRKKTAEEVRALIDRGPFLAQQAFEAGLVDGLAYLDQLDDKEQALKEDGDWVDTREYANVAAAALGLNKGPRIGVIYASGIIMSGESAFDAFSGQILGSDTLIRHIRAARDDRSLRAIVVRIDSPGGSAVASDAIWRELVITRDQDPKRPLVVSMSDLAASGGYYIAMAAPHIVAQPATLTGSIGIVAGKLVTGGTWAKVGANIETVSHGKNAEIYSPVRPFNESERAALMASLQSFYDQFVEKAAKARQMTPEQLHKVAQGRVWTGAQAKEIGLVDELGGLDRAIELAKEKAGIAKDAEVQLVVFPKRRSVYELFAEAMRLETRGDLFAAAALLPADERRALGVLTAPMRLFRRAEPLALMPYARLR
ncbi:MAG TPA: signal peptide peptidase SppA [Vicinamibacterales bacterium]|nr:signal peptide peptidase SppA [Vicinamibacterales bacterium]